LSAIAFSFARTLGKVAGSIVLGQYFPIPVKLLSEYAMLSKQTSQKSQPMIAKKSGHNLEIDQPEAAIAAIVKMVISIS